MSIQTERPIALNNIVAGNKEDGWLQNTTKLRPVSLQPIGEVLALGENTLHPSPSLKLEAARLFESFWQIPIRLHGLLYQKTVVSLFTAPTEIQVSYDRILRINPFCKNKQRILYTYDRAS